MNRPIRVGITHGDINGISYEIILKALADERIPELCTPVLFGSARLLAYFRKHLGIETALFNQCASTADIHDGECNIVNIAADELKVETGRPTEESGRAALLALEQATEAIAAGEIDVLVTAPINKKAIQGDGFNFPGHTEYLQDRLGGEDDHALMILFNDDLRVALVTTHLPLRDIPGALTREKVADTVKALAATLRRDFAIERPRIAVLGLNPHSGDDGLLGSEEAEIIAPAIDDCSAAHILAFGPYPADGFFGSGMWKKFDGVVAMYHDQGLAPFKTLAGTSGVNYTACLPFVRTSPDHGTGYDIAGRGIADPASMLQAIYKAIDIYRNRRDYDRASANPLRRQYVERGADKTIDLSKEELDH